RTLVFYDVDAPESSVLYRIHSIRMIGAIVADEPPNVIDTIFQMASGFVPLNFATPGGTTVMGGDTLKMLLDPAAKIFQGIKIQKSEFSDVQPIFVSLRERPPSPPANLAVDPHKGITYMSIPALSRIFKVNDGDISDFANAGFKAPYQIGLGIDGVGNLYTDNAASDMQFGGRVFKFDGNTTARSFIGTTNYYSFMLQYAKAAMVQAVTIGPSIYGEALYVADGLSNRINQLRLPASLPQGMDLSRNVSQPYAESSLFNFGPNTAMAFRGDGTMLVTNGNNLLLIPAGGGRVDPLFNDTNAQSPYQQLSGVTVDRMGNVYVSDSQLGTVTMLPINAQLPNIGLMGYDDAGKKKLTFVRGLNRPSQIQLAPDARGLVFFDANGLHKIGFGMSGQITGADGSPLAGAKVMTNDRETTLISVTDGDGVYVMPGLIEKANNVVEISIRYNNETQTQRVVLDPIQHNMVDFVFNPPPPPDGNEDIELSPAPVPAPPVEIDVKSGDTVILDTQVSLSKVMPNQNPPPAEDIITRAHILSPGNDMPVTDSTVSIRGFVNDLSITEGTLIVNGVEQEISITNGEFNAPAQLQEGGNDIVVRVPEGGVKGEFVKGTDRNLVIVTNEINEIGVTFGDALAAPAFFTGGAIDPLIDKLAEKAAPQAGEIRTGYQSVRDQASSVLTPLLEGRLPEQGAVDLLRSSTDALAAKANTISGGGGTGNFIKGFINSKQLNALGIDTMLQTIGGKIGAAADGIGIREGELIQQLQSLMQAAPASPARDQVEQAANSYMGSLQPGKLALGAMGLPSNSQMLQNMVSQETLNDAIGQLMGSLNDSEKGLLQNFKAASEATTAFLRESTDEAAADVGGAAAIVSSLAGKPMDSLYSDLAAKAQVTLPAEFTAQVGDTRSQAATVSSFYFGGQLPSKDLLDGLGLSTQAVETGARTLLGQVEQISSMTRNMMIGAAAKQNEIGSQAPLSLSVAAARLGLGMDTIQEALNTAGDMLGKVQNLPKGRVPAPFGPLSTQLTAGLQGMADKLGLQQLPLEGTEEMSDLSRNIKNLFKVNSATLTVPRAATQEAATEHMENTGIDLTIAGRVKDRDTNLPVAGFKMKVPGTDFETSTDADGVYQMQVKLSKLQDCMNILNNIMKQQHDMMKSVINNLRAANDIFDLSRMYAQLGGGGGVVFDDQGMSSFILSSINLQEMLPNCSSNGDGIKDLSRRLEELSTAAYSRVEAGDEMTAEEKLEMQSKLDEMQQLFQTLSSIMKSEHDTSMNIIMNLK
ncbi:MAG: hypothetical protein HY808_13575, partial [Nitrospirae bacterium]|nr:hypothetical protein [Nitrospirota bacterium]